MPFAGSIARIVLLLYDVALLDQRDALTSANLRHEAEAGSLMSYGPNISDMRPVCHGTFGRPGCALNGPT